MNKKIIDSVARSLGIDYSEANEQLENAETWMLESIQVISIVAGFEEDFGIEINPDQFDQFHKMSDIFEVVGGLISDKKRVI